MVAKGTKLTRGSDGIPVSETCVKVDPIYNGSVFDHLYAGTGIEFVKTLEELLGFKEVQKQRAILQYVTSNAHEKKDVVKIADVVVNAEILTKLYEKYPRFTYSIIENNRVVEKYTDAKFRVHPHQAVQATLTHN